MKWSYPYATPETTLPILGYRGEADDVFPLLKELGYKGIEPFVRNPKDFDVKRFTKQLDKHGLEVAAVGTGPVVSEDKLTLSAADPAVREAAVNRAMEIVEFASLFGSQVSIGKLRGDLDIHQPQQSLSWIRGGLERICEHAERYSIRVTLEPQNKKNVNNLNTTKETIQFIHDLQIPNLKLMLDVYHMNEEDRSVTQGFWDGKELLTYVHAADTDRQPPGQGSFDYLKVLRMLQSLNYSGYITMEISQKPDSFEAAKSAVQHLQALLHLLKD
ncbi:MULTISPECIES: sugar phosphate isomerase/epimerase family protein [unclassified Paenibacillus]|uniref:sugar phosphate isomerase/epimerase family protein n=1 Tax=unclassified Paenibacillus TaxID=185978 RepID=UPI00362F40DE